MDLSVDQPIVPKWKLQRSKIVELQASLVRDEKQLGLLNEAIGK